MALSQAGWWMFVHGSQRRGQAFETILLNPPFFCELNDSLNKPTPRSKLRGIYGFLPFGTGRRPTRCFLGTLQRAAGNDQVHKMIES